MAQAQDVTLTVQGGLATPGILCTQAPGVVERGGGRSGGFELRIWRGEDAGGRLPAISCQRTEPPWSCPRVSVTRILPPYARGLPPKDELAVQPSPLPSRKCSYHTKRGNRRLYWRACPARPCSLTGGFGGGGDVHPREADGGQHTTLIDLTGHIWAPR